MFKKNFGNFIIYVPYFPDAKYQESQVNCQQK